MMTNEGIMIRMHCSDITVIGRITSGVKLMNIGKDGNSFVASVAKLARTDEEENNDETDDVQNETEGIADIDEVSDDAESEDVEDTGSDKTEQ